MRLLHRARTWRTSSKRNWRDVRFTVIDVETTGLHLKTDEIVSIGAVDIVGGCVDNATSWYQLVCPRQAIDVEAIKTHGLTRDELAAAPDIADMADTIHERVRDAVPVAHAAWIERNFIDRALAPLGCRTPRQWVDTAALSQAAGMSTRAGYEPHLESLAQELGLPVFTPHHALGDTMTTAVLMIVLATRLESTRSPLSVGDLLEMSKARSQPH